MLGSVAGPPSLAAVGQHPVDVGPYGMVDGAGNVRDWCGNPWLRMGPPLQDGRLVELGGGSEDAAFIAVRGGSWSSVPRLCRAAGRFACPPGHRLGTLGFRVARSYG